MDVVLRVDFFEFLVFNDWIAGGSLDRRSEVAEVGEADPANGLGVAFFFAEFRGVGVKGFLLSLVRVRAPHDVHGVNAMDLDLFLIFISREDRTQLLLRQHLRLQFAHG